MNRVRAACLGLISAAVLVAWAPPAQAGWRDISGNLPANTYAPISISVPDRLTIAFPVVQSVGASVQTVLYRSTDGGSTFGQSALPAGEDLWTAVFPRSSLGYLFGPGTHTYTWDGTPHRAGDLAETSDLAIQRAEFVTATDGWVVGSVTTGGVSRPCAYRTSDGAATWSANLFPSRSDVAGLWLNGVDFTSPANGWACGPGQLVAHTADGGVTWDVWRLGDMKGALKDIAAVGADVWAVGENGTIVHSPDAGVTWQTQASGTTTWLMGVDFPDARHGWAVGMDATIVSTSDGGAHWAKQASTAVGSLYEVHFTDTRSGYAVGADPDCRCILLKFTAVTKYAITFSLAKSSSRTGSRVAYKGVVTPAEAAAGRRLVIQIKYPGKPWQKLGSIGSLFSSGGYKGTVWHGGFKVSLQYRAHMPAGRGFKAGYSPPGRVSRF
jgi:photosystem II stability/assembly factor-like uncharacterized protein